MASARGFCAIGIVDCKTEDHGLKPDALEMCDDVVQLPGTRCLNVATAGSLVLYDRWMKLGERHVLRVTA
jgi:tRNA C32,U32 (ribose-2'-O)-methylase TrmJ